MRTVFFEEEMLKTRRSEVMKEYKSVQPKKHKSPQKSYGQFPFFYGFVKTWASFMQLLGGRGEKPEFEPADS